VREPAQDVTCDFIGGYAFGDAIGIGLRSVSGWWTVKDVTLATKYRQVRPDYESPQAYCQWIRIVYGRKSLTGNTHCAHTNTCSSSRHRSNCVISSS
jgi:hypothetical protein